jgi:hypothetical protein
MHTRILIPTHRSDQVKVAAPPAPARNRGRGRAPPGQFPRRVPCRCLLLTREGVGLSRLGCGSAFLAGPVKR